MLTPNSIKWKDPSENSIDFRITLRFPPRDDNSTKVDFTKRPVCELHQWEGGKIYNWFDNWDITDEEWHNFLNDNIDIHLKIAEFSWLAETQNWKFLRFREDKNDANHSTVVEKIIDSIRDGVEAHQLISKAPRIRSGWKLREQRRGSNISMQTRSPPRGTPSQYKLLT